jgi:hypothetical protein
LTFVDRTSGRAFVAKRVAVRLVYDCATGDTEVLNEPLKDDTGCKRFVDWVVEGYLDGHKLFAIFAESDASPCCGWYSESEASATSDVRGAQWLRHDKVPVIAFEDSEWTIGNEPDIPAAMADHGPLGGGNFAPKVCRTE